MWEQYTVTLQRVCLYFHLLVLDSLYSRALFPTPFSPLQLTYQFMCQAGMLRVSAFLFLDSLRETAPFICPLTTQETLLSSSA